jgi:adenylosuccinate lyase
MMKDFIESLEIPADEKADLLAMTPASYTGNAAAQAKKIKQFNG